VMTYETNEKNYVFGGLNLPNLRLLLV